MAKDKPATTSTSMTNHQSPADRDRPHAGDGGRDQSRIRSQLARDSGRPVDVLGPETETRLSDDDVFLFNEGSHFRLYEKLGAHLARIGGREGAWFAVWAPSARSVSVIGEFNGWDKAATPLRVRGGSGIWEGFIEGVGQWTRYKYHIVSQSNGYAVDKSDPFGFHHETPPLTASIITDLHYEWGDDEWMRSRGERHTLASPMSIYELHLGSWMRHAEQANRPLSYRELAPKLVEHVERAGFTHVEFLPVMEHPFYGSWGYQTTGYFAPTSRYGTPQEFMELIDTLHQAGIGVILDWVPSHFPSDEHGLAYFDGTHLFEHADPRQGYHPDWKSYIFNYGRHEVRSFLISSALYWFDKYHIDGLRVDAVASMLYLDYSRKHGEWIPNEYGGRENIEAIEFLRRLNREIYQAYPDTQTMAEESTAWPMVSRPTYVGGLGFGYKWDMGWMHDTLQYMSRDPIHRRYHHNELTFRAMYQYSENYVLPLSHDEVVHGKGSLIGKMAGDEWRKFANLRLLLANQWTQPGKKLLFMGGEIAQWREWNHDESLDWRLLEYPTHAGILRLVSDLNALLRREPALSANDTRPEGFQWLESNDAEHSVLCFLRRSDRREETIIAAFNYTPVPQYNYCVGAPSGGWWDEILNTDAKKYGGSNMGNFGSVEAAPISCQGFHHALTLTLPPLAAVLLKARPRD